jgi:hypothetical protein
MTVIFGYIPEEWIIGKAFMIYWSQLPVQSAEFPIILVRLDSAD